MFVPAGQTVLLGTVADGSVLLRGQNLNGVKFGDGTISSQGPVFLSTQPGSESIRVVQGEGVMITDVNGLTAEVSSGVTVSTRDIRLDVSGLSVVTAGTTSTQQVHAPTKVVAQKADTADDVPAFVAVTQISSAATEQAAQNVEDTLSRSAPGRQ